MDAKLNGQTEGRDDAGTNRGSESEEQGTVGVERRCKDRRRAILAYDDGCQLSRLGNSDPMDTDRGCVRSPLLMCLCAAISSRSTAVLNTRP
jgi:hypothetical protein